MVLATTPIGYIAYICSFLAGKFKEQIRLKIQRIMSGLVNLATNLLLPILHIPWNLNVYAVKILQQMGRGNFSGPMHINLRPSLLGYRPIADNRWKFYSCTIRLAFCHTIRSSCRTICLHLSTLFTSWLHLSSSCLAANIGDSNKTRLDNNCFILLSNLNFLREHSRICIQNIWIQSAATVPGTVDIYR